MASLFTHANINSYRMVNGYVDRNKDGKSSKAVYHVAKRLGIPSHFVELRHSATHESLPSLDMLQICAHDALNWLWKNYWNLLDNVESSLRQGNGVSTSGVNSRSSSEGPKKSEGSKSQDKIQVKIKQEFKAWRRLRKNGPNDSISDDKNSNAEIAEVINKMNSFVENYEDDVMDVILYKNIMIPKYVFFFR